MSGEQQDNNPESKLDHGYCSTLKGEYLIHSQLFPSLLYCITAAFSSIQRGYLPSNIVTGLTQPGPRSAVCGCVRLASYWLWGFILILLNLPDCDLQIRGGHKMSGHLVMTFAATLWGETGGVLPVSPGTHQKMCWVEKKEWESRKKGLAVLLASSNATFSCKMTASDILTLQVRTQTCCQTYSTHTETHTSVTSIPWKP